MSVQPPQRVYIDIHRHLSASTEACVGIDNFDSQDFNPAKAPSDYFSMGIHPWFIENQDCPTALQTLDNAAHQPKLLAIGECGLDKHIATPLNIQETVFKAQLQIAERYQKPVIIHCVGQYHTLLRIRTQQKSPTPWIIHGFSGNQEIARQLLHHGCYLSFGKALLRDNNSVTQVLQRTPLTRIFLETDAAELSIVSIYEAAAQILDRPMAELQQAIMANFKRVFFND